MNILTVQGNHFECGRQIGQAFKKTIQAAMLESHEYPASGHTWTQTLEKANLYQDLTREHYPYIIDEMTGVAHGAEVNFDELFCYSIEELFATTVLPGKGCTDILIAPPLTDGQIIVGHNNDLSPSSINKVFPVIWQFDDGTSMFTTGPLGYYVSIGVNSYGIALTGNELTPTDNKIGVPRSIVARAILSAKTLDEAVKIAIDPLRASSYNNIITTKEHTVNVEGSGTSFELLSPTEGVLGHSNHYICPSMLKYEGHPEYTSSIERLARVIALSKTKNLYSTEDMVTILSDHNGTQGNANTVCRHDTKSETVFSVIIDFGDGSVNLAMGHPCTSHYEKVWTIPQ